MTPRPQRIARADVLDAALTIIDTDGLEHLTMRRLGTAIGADPMTVYRHFAGKAEITAALADAFWIGLGLPEVEAAATWQDYALRLMATIRAELAVHPGLIPIVATHPITSSAALSAADVAVGRLLESGAPVHPALGDLVNVLIMLTVSSALGEFSAPAGEDPSAEPVVAGASEDADQAAMLEAMPHLGRIMAAGWAPSAERQFQAGVRAVLDGWRFDPEPVP